MEGSRVRGTVEGVLVVWRERGVCLLCSQLLCSVRVSGIRIERTGKGSLVMQSGEFECVAVRRRGAAKWRLCDSPQRSAESVEERSEGSQKGRIAQDRREATAADIDLLLLAF